ncbi:hypothetical protein LSH36_92g05014 [Paralvinella palmiformis]|uniref:GPR158/179 extracellular domain-containing protein n=1 Tax=Paralvinella palmiformis TaxID=53620 RepID=A0AAD9K118_9ANNE|nr:hypothetical protein LSH36_92g05014 [Paralvinella palmiformis]
MARLWCLLAVLVGFGVILTQGVQGPYDWMGYDNFDEIADRMDAVNAQNCRSKPASTLMLPADTLAQLPRFNKLLSTVIYPNRTDMLHQHNMALNRAFFYSYIFQKLNYSSMFYDQPGMMYYYLSAVADLSANEYNINGSSVIFDQNCSYPNWYRNLPFNETLPLFGPRAWRLDNYNEPTNWNREPTNRTLDIVDYGAGPQHNYTMDAYKINQWYSRWLPDGKDMQGLDSVRKHSYDVGIKYSNATGKFTHDEYIGKVFFGPPSPGQKETEHLPVVYTQPFFDCGRSNRWIVSAVSPIVDQLPRYLDWLHLRRMRFVATSVMDMEFLQVDINPCPLGIGNQPPNYFHNIAKCKPTTLCEPLYGWGFRRGGYQCWCKPGYRLPPWQQGPFMGIEIESATEDEYKEGFNCIPIELKYVIPRIDNNETAPDYNVIDRENLGRRKRSLREGDPIVIKPEPQPDFVRRTNIIIKKRRPSHSQILSKKLRFLRNLGLTEKKEGRVQYIPRRSFADMTPVKKLKKNRFVPRYRRDTESLHRRKRQTSHTGYSTWDDKAYDRMLEIFAKKDSVNSENCARKKPEELMLPGDVAYGVEKQFSAQARTALRLSHFLSNFMQNIDMYEEYGNLRGDRLLNIEQLFGEVVANVMGDLRIRGSGLFYDVDKFIGPGGRTRQFFGPYAYRYEKEDEGEEADRANTHFRAIDFAGFPTHYLDEPWFKNVKERWQSNTYGLDKFTERAMIRSDLAGTSLKKFELYPQYFYAPKEEDGWWSAPYFECQGFINDWILTYSVPFFGLNSIGSAIEFKGVVRVDVRLDLLDINQCPMDFHVPNAFKDTARCHFDNTYCYPLPGQTFRTGAYKCECNNGYEYPYEDRAWYFDGQTMEEEYRKLLAGQKNRYHTLQCRISGSSHITHSIAGLLIVVISLLV